MVQILGSSPRVPIREIEDTSFRGSLREAKKGRAELIVEVDKGLGLSVTPVACEPATPPASPPSTTAVA